MVTESTSRAQQHVEKHLYIIREPSPFTLARPCIRIRMFVTCLHSPAYPGHVTFYPNSHRSPMRIKSHFDSLILPSRTPRPILVEIIDLPSVLVLPANAIEASRQVDFLTSDKILFPTFCTVAHLRLTSTLILSACIAALRVVFPETSSFRLI